MSNTSTWIFAAPTRRLLQKVVDPPLSSATKRAAAAAKAAAATSSWSGGGGLPPIYNENTAVTSIKTLPGGGGQVQQHQQQHQYVPTTKTPLPKRIILIRHGESLGNVDDTSYGHIPDWKIPLTRRGERQAFKAAQDLQQLLQEDGEDRESLFTYCSPYMRTEETWEIMKQQLLEVEEEELKRRHEKYEAGELGDDTDNKTIIHLIGTREEPRIAEQQFGNFQNPHKVRTAKAERMSFGRFFFRFPNGEAGLDVYNRVSSFWATVSRDLLQLQAITDVTHLNILIVTHGLTLRLLLMRYFQLSVAEFESSYNSQNAKLVIMERKYSPETDKEYFQLQEEAKEALNLKGDISNNLPVYWRGDALDYRPYDREEDDT